MSKATKIVSLAAAGVAIEKEQNQRREAAALQASLQRVKSQGQRVKNSNVRRQASGVRQPTKT
jgi:hypothetical protein